MSIEPGVWNNAVVEKITARLQDKGIKSERHFPPGDLKPVVVQKLSYCLWRKKKNKLINKYIVVLILKSGSFKGKRIKLA